MATRGGVALFIRQLFVRCGHSVTEATSRILTIPSGEDAIESPLVQRSARKSPEPVQAEDDPCSCYGHASALYVLAMECGPRQPLRESRMGTRSPRASVPSAEVLIPSK